jgi:flagellar basal body-associated protein FliL
MEERGKTIVMRLKLRVLLGLLWLLAGFATAGPTPARAAEAAPAQRKTTQSESYIPFDPIYASIIDGIRPRGLLLVEMGLDVPDEKLRQSVTLALPLLRDAYVRSLITYASTAVRPYRQPNLDDVANRMQTITDKLVGREGARVLMAQLAIRLIR